jgi:hypothetical protein
LIFDSWFDPYHGAVVLVRIMNGVVRKGERIRLMAAEQDYDITRLSVLTPAVRDKDELGPGEVGVIAASIKEIAHAKIGDTVTHARHPAPMPLPGFKAVKPMVFAGLYPADTGQYESLRTAVEKLKLNDSSFSYEPESSVALGFGFRCGFLGLLHMEIVQERLEREFALTLITTAPTVAYRVTTTAGEVVMIDSPTKLPPVQTIATIEEPLILATVHLPAEYMGGVLKLCEDKRGKQREIKYLGESRVMLIYELPLNEIVVDFYDRLKSVSKGYASLDYELHDFAPSDLVKLDVRINGDIVDALSLIVHRDRAYMRWSRSRVAHARAHPAADVRGGDPGVDRLEGDRARDREGDPQERHRQVLRRRHHPQAQAPRGTEGGQEAHEAGRSRRDPPGGLPGGAEGRPVKGREVAKPATPAEPGSLPRAKSTFREYAEALVVALALALFIRTFFVQAFKIPSGSMLPTLQIGDHLLVNKLLYGLRVPVYGTRLGATSSPSGETSSSSSTRRTGTRISSSGWWASRAIGSRSGTRSFTGTASLSMNPLRTTPIPRDRRRATTSGR